MEINGVVVRRRVTDLDAAVSFYERLLGQDVRRFAFSGAELASVGPFLLFTAQGEPGDRLARVVATITVDDLDECTSRLTDLGAEIVAPAAETPNGRRLVARHPDGAVVEYTGH